MKNIVENILHLYLQDAITNSNQYLDILYHELGFYKEKLKDLEKQKPYWFQKRKLKDYQKEIDEIQDNIFKCENKIKKEYNLIQKMFER